MCLRAKVSTEHGCCLLSWDADLFLYNIAYCTLYVQKSSQLLCSVLAVYFCFFADFRFLSFVYAQ